MRRVILVLAMLAVIVLGYFAVQAIANHRATPSQSVGDSCLVGTWVLQREQGHYTTSTTRLNLTGLAGATLTITGTGAAVFDYDASAMEKGGGGGQAEQAVLRGTRKAQMHAKSGTLAISSVANDATWTVTLNGVVQAAVRPPDPNPGKAGYSCSQSRLQIDGQNTAGDFTYSDIYNRQP